MGRDLIDYIGRYFMGNSNSNVYSLVGDLGMNGQTYCLIQSFPSAPLCSSVSQVPTFHSVCRPPGVWEKGFCICARKAEPEMAQSHHLTCLLSLYQL